MISKFPCNYWNLFEVLVVIGKIVIIDRICRTTQKILRALEHTVVWYAPMDTDRKIYGEQNVSRTTNGLMEHFHRVWPAPTSIYRIQILFRMLHIDGRCRHGTCNRFRLAVRIRMISLSSRITLLKVVKKWRNSDVLAVDTKQRDQAALEHVDGDSGENPW